MATSSRHRRPNHMHICSECSAFYVGHKSRTVCSTTCRSRRNKRQWRERDPEGWRAYRKRNRDRNRPNLEERICSICARRFSCRNDRPTHTCSPKCKGVVLANRARADRLPAIVLDRRPIHTAVRLPDDPTPWRCQLCGGRVQRNRETPHPKAPVLDHILPLAAGGTHEPANVQLAHFICNSEKGDRPADDQLRLIG